MTAAAATKTSQICILMNFNERFLHVMHSLHALNVPFSFATFFCRPLRDREVEQARRATATRTPQNNRFNEHKQSLCTCILQLGTFLCLPLQNSNVKKTNFRFSRERERRDCKLVFPFPTLMPFIVIQSLDSSSALFM